MVLPHTPGVLGPVSTSFPSACSKHVCVCVCFYYVLQTRVGLQPVPPKKVQRIAAPTQNGVPSKRGALYNTESQASYAVEWPSLGAFSSMAASSQPPQIRTQPACSQHISACRPAYRGGRGGKAERTRGGINLQRIVPSFHSVQSLPTPYDTVYFSPWQFLLRDVLDIIDNRDTVLDCGASHYRPGRVGRG